MPPSMRRNRPPHPETRRHARVAGTHVSDGRSACQWPRRSPRSWPRKVPTPGRKVSAGRRQGASAGRQWLPAVERLLLDCPKSCVRRFALIIADPCGHQHSRSTPWPGAGIVWANLDRGRAKILDRPPRGVGSCDEGHARSVAWGSTDSPISGVRPGTGATFDQHRRLGGDRSCPRGRMRPTSRAFGPDLSRGRRRVGRSVGFGPDLSRGMRRVGRSVGFGPDLSRGRRARYGVKANELTITSTGWPSVGAAPPNSHRFSRTRSSLVVGTSAPV